MTARPRIAVLGSVHMDLIAQTERLPGAGESVTGTGFAMAPGGKGGNQAAQCAGLGAEAFMITQLGDDLFGRDLLAALPARGIDCRAVRVSATQATGASTIFASGGDYCSIIVPGAAAALTADEVEASLKAVMPLQALLLQLELPVALSERAARVAKTHGALVVLNASPAPTSALSPALLAATDVIVVNRVEAQRILGASLAAEMAAEKLRALGPRIAVVTLGGDGAVACDAAGVVKQAAFPVTISDAVGAGDAFLGSFTVALLRGEPLAAALRDAAAAGALAASRRGSSAITRNDIEDFLGRT